MRKLTLLVLLLSILNTAIAQAPTKILSFETSEVTQPTLSMMPGGKSFVFNLLGHLFEMPVFGGQARQLTFGPYYDSDPVVSPNGKQIAFISNRDGSDGNIFVLDLATKNITQVTQEFMAGSPAWSANGESLAYLSYLRREEYPVDKVPFFGSGNMASVCTISANGNNRKQLTESGTYVAPFFTNENACAWGVIVSKGEASFAGPGAPPPAATTRFETKTKDGMMQPLGTINGNISRVAFTPNKQGFYYAGSGMLRYYAMGDTVSKVITPLKGAGWALALSADEKTIYAAADAALWQLDISTASLSKLSWTASVKMEVVPPAIKKWVAPTSSSTHPSEVLTPRLSPNGKTIIFMAAGFLWQQAIGEKAKRLIEDDAYQLDPAFSPNGSSLAYISDLQGKRALKIFDFVTGQTKTIATTGGYSWMLQPQWSPDGKTILFQRSDALGAPYKFILANASTGDTTTLATSGSNWNGRPHFSADGQAIYFTARKGMFANVFKLSLQPGAKPEAITNLQRHAHDALISPDGKWMAFRRNAEIWIAALKNQPIGDTAFRLFSKTGGRSFAFTPDGTAIIYADGNKVLKQAIADNSKMAIAINLKIQEPQKAPVLISNVHVLNLQTGKFSPETSVYIEGNRIQWVGEEKGKSISPKALRIPGQGRFVIPGIFDMHTHAAWSNQQITEDRLIAYGVTSVRDVGSRLDVMNVLRDKGSSTLLPVPRYFASGDIYEGLVPLWGDAFFEINSKEEAREYVQYSKAHGASFLKVYASLPWYIKTEVAAEAKRQGMPVVGHGISLEEIVRSVNFGITSLEHGGPNNDDVVKLMVHAGTLLDPTPGIFGAGTPLKLADSATLDKKFRIFTPEEELMAARPGRIPSEAQVAAWKNSLAALKRLNDSGVKMLDGTDALMTGVFHGPSVHWVLQFFSDAGIPNIDVLRIATLRSAEAVGASHNLGSVEPGKLADILLLDANPLQDIKNTLKIWRVIKDGVVYDPATLR